MLLFFYWMTALSGDARVTPPLRPAAPLVVTACAAVTKADVEEALGRRVGDGAEEVRGLVSTCDYAGGGGMVSVTIQRLTATPDRAVEIAGLKREIPEAVVRDAPVFGDAFFLDVPGAGTQLHVIRGDRAHLMISVLGFGEAAQVSTAAARIARKALGRF